MLANLFVALGATVLMQVVSPPTIIPPTPIATMAPLDLTIDVEVPRSEIYSFLATAAANINQLPAQIDRDPSGTSLIPSDDARNLLGYAKWLFSPATARELMGEALSPLGINAFVLFTLIVFLTSAWLLVKIATMLIKAVVWLIQQALRLIPFIG
jgi:hypothetical protein